VPEEVRLRRGHQPQRPLEEREVPVRLRAVGGNGRVIRAEQPYRVDLRERPEHREHAEDEQEQRRGLEHEEREHRHADLIALPLPPARPLRVPLVPDTEQVPGDQRQDQPRQQQDVHEVEPGDDDGPRVLPAEQEEAQVGAGDRHGLHDALRDPQARAGQQVVRQRVAGEPLDAGQREHRGTDEPVDLARPAERPGEEDPQRVDRDRRDEHERRPVVDLPDEQPAADVEADPQCRGERLAHRDAVQLDVAAVVSDLGHARLEEERQESARDEQDDERVEGQLPEEERPVIGKYLAQRPPGGPRRVKAVVEVPGRLAQVHASTPFDCRTAPSAAGSVQRLPTEAAN
jgi:hypothetical protein